MDDRIEALRIALERIRDGLGGLPAAPALARIALAIDDRLAEQQDQDQQDEAYGLACSHGSLLIDGLPW